MRKNRIEREPSVRLRAREGCDRRNKQEVRDFLKFGTIDEALPQLERMFLICGYCDVQAYIKQRWGEEGVQKSFAQQKIDAEARQRFEQWEDDNSKMVARLNRIFD